MKRGALCAAIALALAPGSLAQLSGGLGDGKILRGIDDMVDRSIDGAVKDSVTDAVAGRVDRSVEKLLQAKDLPGAVLDPLLDLPLPPLRKEVTVDDNWRALDREWVALIAPDQLAALRASNVQIISQRTLSATGLVLVRVVVSEQDDLAGRAQALLRSLGAAAADRNHLYDERRGPAPAFHYNTQGQFAGLPRRRQLRQTAQDTDWPHTPRSHL